MSQQKSFALESAGYGIALVLRQFDGASPIACARVALEWRDAQEIETSFAGGVWEGQLRLTTPGDRPDAVDGSLTLRLESGRADQVSVAVEFIIPDWSTQNYVLCPAAVYNGNRFAVRPLPYPPMYKDPADIALDPPVLITDVPHLALGEGESRLQLNTGDMATPCVGFFSPGEHQGFLLMTVQETRLGNSGLHLRESEDRSSATITLEAPGIRSGGMYTMGCSTHPAIDRAPAWKVGDELTLTFRIFAFAAQRVQHLFDRFAAVRKDLTPASGARAEIPFSAAWRIQEDKHNRDNWRYDSYYAVGQVQADGKFNDWQAGWVGGGMNTLPLLLAGSAESRQRARATLDWIFAHAQTQSGLVVGVIYGADGREMGDGFGTPGTDRWVMTRKCGDLLYFLMKHLILLRRQGAAIPPAWLDGTRRLADRFVSIWRQHGQFGQLLDYQTGEIAQGGSTAGAIVPAGLALAGQWFGDAGYIEAAEASADFHYNRDVTRGLTTGGPGEILSAPDSESSFAMVESLVVLHEVTGHQQWLDRAGEMARQFSTWVHSYDYRFPPESPFGRLGMQTTGSVWANAQNKHSAPGICTLSGDALFKLWRATREPFYLQLACDIVHGTPQYLSRQDRPVQDLPDGWMCERVNTCDWEYSWCPPGHVFRGSCWCEISNMLSYVELPGLYVNVDLDVVCAFDHVEARIIGREPGAIRIMVTNPTRFDASVRVLVERESDLARPLGQMSLAGCRELRIPAGQSVELLARPSASGG